jgi:hypothetical protein
MDSESRPVALDTPSFCIAWNWEHDAGFIRYLEKAATGANSSLFQVTPQNLELQYHKIIQGEVSLIGFLDRASDSDMSFNCLSSWARQNVPVYFNHPLAAARANDKAEMHYALINAGLQTPYSIVIPPFEKQPDLPPLDLAPLGSRFAIKPAHGGGSEGVIMEARDLTHIVDARRQFPMDSYLLQATICPVILESKPAWFRILYCCGLVFASWWHPTSHLYTIVSEEQIEQYHLVELERITRIISNYIALDLFSTEIALTEEGRFVVVDYINDPIDLRLQSDACDGVPDIIVQAIATCLIQQSLLRSCHED